MSDAVYIVEGHAWDEESNSLWKVGAYKDKKIADDLCQKLNETLGDCLMPIVIKYCEKDGYLKEEFFDRQRTAMNEFESLIAVDGVLSLDDMSFYVMGSIC